MENVGNSAIGTGRVAIIGSGVSGIASGKIWKQCGYDVTIFEASDCIGGQWTKSYPGVTLQNIAPQYQFSDFPWPFEPDFHPTAAQVLRYLEAAVTHYQLDIRLKNEVTAMVRDGAGWRVTLNGTAQENFDYVVLATGQYPGGKDKYMPPFEGMDQFRGEILTNIPAQEIFDKKRVVVVGFGKTALDFATWSAARAISTTHVFRTPRWSIPETILGINYSRPFFARFGSDMLPSWCHSSAPQRFLHKRLAPVVRGFWSAIASLFRFQHRRDAKLGAIDKSVLDAVIPENTQFVPDLRSALALAPERYFEHVAHGKITPKRGEVARFDEEGVLLAGGGHVEAELVLVCCGNQAPGFSFLPEEYRGLLEGRSGGPALYRHLIDPRIPDLGFAGFNHGFLHIALCELGALWQVAAFTGNMALPSEAEMLASAERVSQWKQSNSAYEPTYNMAVNTRFQQQLDILAQDLGLSQWRKMPNFLAEFFARYDPTDYNGIVEEYRAKLAGGTVPETRHMPVPVDA